MTDSRPVLHKRYIDTHAFLRGSMGKFQDHIKDCLESVGLAKPLLKSDLEELASIADLGSYGYYQYIKAIRNGMKDDNSFIMQILKPCYLTPNLVAPYLGLVDKATVNRDIVTNSSKNIHEREVERLKANLEKIYALHPVEFLSRLMELPAPLSEPCLRYIPYTSFASPVGTLVTPTSTTTTSSSGATSTTTSGDTNLLMKRIADAIQKARSKRDNDASIGIDGTQNILNIHQIQKRSGVIPAKTSPAQTDMDNTLVMKSMIYFVICLFKRITLFKTLRGSVEDYFYHDLPDFVNNSGNGISGITKLDLGNPEGRRYFQDLMPWYYVLCSELMILIALLKENESNSKGNGIVVRFYKESFVKICEEYLPFKLMESFDKDLQSDASVSTTLERISVNISEETRTFLITMHHFTEEKFVALNTCLQQFDQTSNRNSLQNFTNSDSGLIKIMWILATYMGENVFSTFFAKLSDLTVINFSS